MAKIKKKDENKDSFSVEKKRNGKYWVRAKGGKAVNGLEKTRILLEKGLVKTGVAKKKEEAATEEQT